MTQLLPVMHILGEAQASVIEFKLNDTKEAALQQIHDKQYAQKYQNSGKEIILLGVEFDQQTRHIGDHVEQRVEQKGEVVFDRLILFTIT